MPSSNKNLQMKTFICKYLVYVIEHYASSFMIMHSTWEHIGQSFDLTVSSKSAVWSIS